MRNLSQHSVFLLIPDPAASDVPLPAMASLKGRGRPRAVSGRALCDAAPYLVPTAGPKRSAKIAPARTPTHGAAWPANAPRCQLPGLAAHELAVIDAALAIVAMKLREPGSMIDSSRRRLPACRRPHLAANERSEAT